MRRPLFQTANGREVPAVTESEMREVDRIAVEDFGLGILHQAGILPISQTNANRVLQDSTLVIDALIGYSLLGSPSGTTAALIQLCNHLASRVLSLDVPSGVDATSGATLGVAVLPERTLTLALPKTGPSKIEGDLYVADIGIPPEVYARMGITFEPLFKQRGWMPLFTIDPR